MKEAKTQKSIFEYFFFYVETDRSKELTKQGDISHKNRRKSSVVEEEERGEARRDEKGEEQQNEINHMMPCPCMNISQ